jgi:hypothetical protein
MAQQVIELDDWDFEELKIVGELAEKKLKELGYDVEEFDFRVEVVIHTDEPTVN